MTAQVAKDEALRESNPRGRPGCRSNGTPAPMIPLGTYQGMIVARNTERRGCKECGRVHRYITKGCVVVVLSDAVLEMKNPGTIFDRQNLRRLPLWRRLTGRFVYEYEYVKPLETFPVDVPTN